MDYLITICGCLGGWLLVAGPIYQAALELREQEIDREEIDAVLSSVAPVQKLSPWWWLLPPVAYLLQRRRSRDHHEAVMNALDEKQKRQTLNFMNKATGWLIVSLGALLLAIKETWELVRLLDWPVAVFWVSIVVFALLCLLNAVLQVSRTSTILKKVEQSAATAENGPPGVI